MNYLTVDLFKDFQCIADACPNTCCVGWRILIDKATYQKMIEYEDQLGTPAKNWLQESDGIIVAKLENQRCPMLTETNLCNVVLKLGPEYLSDTCKYYPRILREYGSVIEGHLTMSCPNVISKLMDKDCIEFDFAEDNTPALQYPHTQLYLFESSVRTSIVDILQDFPNITLSTRLFVAYKILDRAIQSYQGGKIDFNSIQQNMAPYLQENPLLLLDVQLQGVVNEEKRFAFLQQLQRVATNYTRLDRFTDLVIQTNNYLSNCSLEEYLSDLTSFRTSIQKYNTFYTNYWVYRIFSDIIEIPDYALAKERFIYIATEFCLIQTIALASFSANKKLDRDEYIYIISCISRMMEHNNEFRQQLLVQLNNNDSINIAGLLLMILI